MTNQKIKSLKSEIRKIHFIGICGVAMSALAIAFKKAGFEVSGSDVGFFPPVSTNLEKHNIKFYPGWHVDKMLENGTPDLVIVGNVASSTNPEWLYVQEQKLNYKSYPEVIKEFFVKPNSIVCAGTYGKTTTSSLLTWILKQNNFAPSYMFGGISLNNIPAAEITDSEYSVLEGDEYKSSRWDNGPKFAHYSPTHLLLTAVEWDHADVYPTKKLYFDVFQKLVNSVPKNGLIVASEQISDIRYHISDIITYGKSQKNNYQYSNIKQTKNGIEFEISHNAICYLVSASMFGEYNAENITGAFALAHQIGIPADKITSAIASFKNIKRRLEKRYDSDITVFDDIAHSPAKVKGVLATLRAHSDTERFRALRGRVEREESFGAENVGLQNSSEKQNISASKDSSSANANRLPRNESIFCVFEPNGGNRQVESIPGYDNAFINADEVIIPRLTAIKQDPNKPEPMDGQRLAKLISKTHNNVKYIEDDSELINYLIKNTKKGDVIVFCGSHGFRGMIDHLVLSFRTPTRG